MSLNIDIEEWKKGIPQRELEQKIREYEEDYPKREKMTPQARENNQTRFFLEDRFYELHKQQLADMLKKQVEENGKVCFREGYPGIVPSVSSYSDGYVSSGSHTPSSSPYSGGEHGGAYSGRGLEGTYSGRGLDSANTGLETSALTPVSYGTAGGNGGQQVAGGYGNGYTADYVQPSKMEGLGAIAAAYKILTEKGYSDINKHQTMSYMLDTNIYPGTGEVLGAIKEDYWDKPKKKFRQSWKEAEVHLDELFPGDSRDDILPSLLHFPYAVHFYQDNNKNNGFREIELDSQKDMLNNQLGGYRAQNGEHNLNYLMNNAIAGQSQQAIVDGLSDDEIGRIINSEPNKMPKDFVNKYRDNPYTKDWLAIYDKHIKY